MEEIFNSFKVKVELCRENAEIPSRKHPLDVGYDISAIELLEIVHPPMKYVFQKKMKVYLYGTGLKIEPPEGFYFDMVPRSSLVKRGYLFANSLGVIDPGYRGELKIPLVKLNEDIKDLELPCRVAQLILRKTQPLEFIEKAQLKRSQRGERGFGSTG